MKSSWIPGGPDPAVRGLPAAVLLDGAVKSPLETAIHRTSAYLLAEQHPDGYWVGELEGDTILESEYLLLLAYLGRENSELGRRLARYVLQKQLPGGGWAIYPGGPIEVSASVKAYFCLKLLGHDPQSEAMRRARGAIRAAGGAEASNSFTRFYLALLGQIDYDCCPVVPPEMILCGRIVRRASCPRSAASANCSCDLPCAAPARRRRRTITIPPGGPPSAASPGIASSWRSTAG
jgi:squalene-hopene/tetraprenyl-beta-curcumene cyclase